MAVPQGKHLAALGVQATGVASETAQRHRPLLLLQHRARPQIPHSDKNRNKHIQVSKLASLIHEECTLLKGGFPHHGHCFPLPKRKCVVNLKKKKITTELLGQWSSQYLQLQFLFFHGIENQSLNVP